MKSTGVKDYLPLVRRPSRYIGGEVNSVRKDLAKVALKFGLGFPDLYEVGMSHLGLQVLYQVLNAREEIACERVFAPWADMEGMLREKGLRLSTLESNIPLKDLDVMGFSLQYELSYTNVLQMLDLGGIPLLSEERRDRDPFVIGGGPAAFNPEPVAPFFDAFLLGDGEEAVLEIAGAVMEGRSKGEGRKDILKRLFSIEGVYVPSFFEVAYRDDNTIKEIIPLFEEYRAVKKRTVPDINRLPLPVRPVVPFAETIHDRLTVEISRGCTRGCRFCQAGMIYRPVRERTPELVMRLVEEGLKNTGYDEVSLLSLSAGDYTLIEDLLPALMRRFSCETVAVSLPSLRVGTLSSTLAGEIRKVRKTGFTLAPEAGSERLRKLINKGIKEEDLLESAREVFSLGWRSMKLYFMIGLPTETDDDLLEIVRLAECLRKIGKSSSGGKAPQINVAVSTFIPKPYTPFQWEPQVAMEESVRKQNLLRKMLGRAIGFKWHDPEMSVLEGVFSRGDRRLSGAILRAYRKGCRFDGWSEVFRFNLWTEAFAEEGIDYKGYIYRRRHTEEALPWDHLNSPGVEKRFLRKELENALALAETPDCKVDRCSNCGVCDHKTIKNRPVEDMPALGETARKRASVEKGYTVRLGFSKTGDARFLGHLELSKSIIRAVRRAGLQVLYSKGFHPMPRISLSPPAPVGMESIAEHMEIELNPAGGVLSPEEVSGMLNGVLPEGIKFSPLSPEPLKVSKPSAIIDEVEYLIFLKNGPLGLDIEPERLEGLIRDFKKKDSITVRIEKAGKAADVDLRPYVEEISVAGDSTLRLRVRKAEGTGIRPYDVVSCLLNLPREDAPLIPVLKTRPFLSKSN